jgi:lipopolysaccharide export system protein LptA
MKPRTLPSALFLAALLTLCTPSVRLMAQQAGPYAPPDTSGGFNLSPFGSQGAGERPKNSRTIIESEDGASFENASNSADFTGHVVVDDPQFHLTCEKLHVVLRPDRRGLEKVVASGSVIITQEKKNENGDVVKSVSKSGKATYDASTGDMTLEDWPQIQQGINNQIATEKTTVMVLNSKGHSRTIGRQRTMIVDQGGDKPLTP